MTHTEIYQNQPFDGPTLRAIRESMGIPLRRVARAAGMSHGHLSKVERGEHGRPITPAVLVAYEKSTGVSLIDAARAISQNGTLANSRGRSWTPGHLTDLRRLQFNAAIGAISMGGALGEPLLRVLDIAGRPGAPTTSHADTAAQLHQVADLLVTLDLRHGSALTHLLAKHLLRWAGGLVQANLWEPGTRPLYQVLAVITHRAAWAAFDQNHHDSARSLYRMALFCAVRAQDHDLRGHVIADIAAQQNHLGYHDDAINLLRTVEADERLTPVVRMTIHAVRARAHAALGTAYDCHQQIQRAEQGYRDADPDQPGWPGRTAAASGLLHATTGHALATLATETGKPADATEAVKRLTQAIDTLNPDTHTRSRALCHAHLALLHITTADIHHATHHGTQAAQAANQVQSARLTAALETLRTTALDHPDTNATRDLIEAIGTTLNDTPQATANTSPLRQRPTGIPGPAPSSTRPATPPPR